MPCASASDRDDGGDVAAPDGGLRRGDGQGRGSQHDVGNMPDQGALLGCAGGVKGGAQVIGAARRRAGMLPLQPRR